MEVRQLKDGTKVWVDFQADTVRCKLCRRRITWAYMETGKLVQIEEKDGWLVPHAPECKGLALVEARRREYQPATNGVDTDVKWIKKI